MMAFFMMLLRLVGMMLRDVLLRRVVRPAVMGMFGGLGVTGAEQDPILEHVELREPDRARGGAQGGRITVCGAVVVRGWMAGGAGRDTRV
jgi:hypothetical protein